MIYKCANCGAVIQHSVCGACNARAKTLPDVHLTDLDLDAYASLQTDGRRIWLLIKKPSGQERVTLNRHDFLR